MSSGGPRNPGKGGSNRTKQTRTDSRPEKPDLNLKTQIKPTAEQMQLAKIIDSHRNEDPELREKIKTVMEITRVSEDEACMALHSKDYDTAQAITLLTDGENLSVEWEQAGKKKKPKAPTPKNELPRGRDMRDRSEKRGERLDSDQIENSGDGKRGERGERGGRGMGRGRGGRGGRGGISRVENKENDERSKGGVERIPNGPPRGGSRGIGRGRGAVRGGDPGRTFASRARVGREDAPNSSIGMWVAEAPADKAERPMKVGEWNGGFPSADDWDNEEYTGSLQETKVFTASNAPTAEQANGVAPNHVAGGPAVENSISSAGAGDALTDPGVSSMNNVSGTPGNIASGQGLDLSMLLPKPQSTSNVNPGADILASLQSSYANSNQNNVGPTQALPPRHKVQRPQGPKIPSSAVEMPVDPVTGLDIKFGGLDFDDTSSLSFGPVMHGQNAKPDLMYNSAAAGIDAYPSNEKDSVSKGAPVPAPSPFHNQRTTPATVDTAAAIPNNIDAVSLQTQKNASPQSYGNVQQGSAYANYPKGVQGYTTVAPGFAPVGVAGAATYNNPSVGNGTAGVTVPSYTGNSASAYQNMGSMPYGGNAPVVSAVPAQAAQPLNSHNSYSASQPQTGYGSTAAPSNYNQYGNYGSKMQSSLGAQSGSEQSGDSSIAPVSSGSSLGMGSMQASGGLPSTTVNPKISAASNMAGSNSGAKMNIPPGMMMQPQYILNPAQAYYQVQAPFYGFDENMQMRVPTQFPGYYDTTASNYAQGTGGPGSGRNDGTTIQGYTSGADARFPRSDSSTASPVPSNIPGQSAQQPMYNPGAMQGYYFLGNNMMHPGAFQYPPPPPPGAYLHPTSAIVTSTNPTGAAHAGSTNHQYPKKGGGGQLYGQQYGYDGTQQGTDYGKNSSYSGGPGPNSTSGKNTSATSSGSSQSTDLNSSMYPKGQLGKMNSYDKSYGGGGYNSMGSGSNPLTSPLSGSGMGGQYYIQQDGTSGSRQGGGQPPNSKQYGGGGGGPAYWPN